MPSAAQLLRLGVAALLAGAACTSVSTVPEGLATGFVGDTGLRGDRSGGSAACPRFDAATARARAVGWSHPAVAALPTAAAASLRVGLDLLRADAGDAAAYAVSPPAVLAPLVLLLAGADDPTRAELQSLLGVDLDATVLADELVQASRSLAVADAPWSSSWAVGAFADAGLGVREDWAAAAAALLEGPVEAPTPWTPPVVDRAVAAWEAGTPCAGASGLEVSEQTRLVLLARWALSAPWASPLVDEGVPPLAFQPDAGPSVQVEALRTPHTEPLRRAAVPGGVAIRRPLVGDLEVVWLLPDAGLTVRAFLGGLDAEAVAQAVADAAPFDALLVVPPSRVRSTTDLVDAWGRQGVSSAFVAETARFDRLTPIRGLHLDVARHVVALELGAQAVSAAATTVVTGAVPGSGDLPAEIVLVDRSHVWGVRDAATGVWWSLSWVRQP
ncbi:MAG: hypothetical protein H6732_13995 [Alphaproteobacteria bacterium]|nr:hypothetical protein [Alphaproteobacteria bacterium]